MGSANLLSVVFKESASDCRMKFYVYGAAKQDLLMNVGVRNLNNSAVAATVKWQLPG